MRVAFILFAIALMVPGVATAQYKPERGATIAVKGEGEVERKPELARFVVTVRTRADTLKAASDEHKVRAAQAISPLNNLGEGARILRSSFSIDEKSDLYSTNNAPSKKWFEATTAYSIEVTAMPRLNAVLNGLVNADLFELGRVTFAIKDDRKAVNDAREVAVADARQRAESLAKAAGVVLGEVLDITDDEAYPRRYAGEEAADLVPDGSVQIIPPETLTFYGTVNMTWRIAPR